MPASPPGKRHVSLLVPYRRSGGELYFFLQMRDSRAPIYPNRLGFFGGHVEAGEGAEEAMLREIAEELVFRPEGYFFFGRYEAADVARDVFAVEVDAGFEAAIEVREGEYGAFFAASALDSEPLVIDAHRGVLRDLARRLLSRGG